MYQDHVRYEKCNKELIRYNINKIKYLFILENID